MTDVPAACPSPRTSAVLPREVAHLSPASVLLIELALAVGGFGIGTGEFAIMGLLPMSRPATGSAFRRRAT